MFSEDEIVWTVIVEFDGAKTGKSLYYRRLHAMGLYVRGESKEKPVLERRYMVDGGDGPRIMVQEATVTCVSEQLARFIAHTAQDCGAAAVTIISGRIQANITKSRRDAEIINRIEEKASKRGRKPEPENWVCTCLECLKQSEQTVPYVMNCTHCGGLLIHTRKGHITPYADPGGDVIGAWKALRFSRGTWEPCPIDNAAAVPAMSIELYNAREAKTCRSIESSPHLSAIHQMPRENAFDFLDAIMVAYAYDNQENRAERRVRVITDLMMRGGDVSKVNFVEPSEPDLIDAAALGIGKVVGWLLQG
jgi:hypothetical protein